MKKILLSLIICVVVVFGSSVSVAAEPDLTLDFNKRYTDISEVDEADEPYFDASSSSQEKEQKRNIYVIVLCICLVIAIVVFIYTLRKVPSEKELQGKSQGRDESKELNTKEADDSLVKDTLKDEEKRL